MSTDHRGGNIQPTLDLEEHDGVNNAKKVNVVAGGVGQATVNINGSATIFAVVNTAAAGQASVVLDNSLSKIGFVTTFPATAWPDPKTYIGLVTITGSLAAAAGNVTLDPGSKTGIVGNVTLSDSKTYIGLTTATIGNNPVLGAGVNGIGFATVNVANNVGIAGNTTLSDAKTYVGLTTSTLGVGDRFIGLTTTVLGNNSIQAFGQFFPSPQSIASGGLGPILLDNFGRVQAKLTADPNIYVGLVTATVGNSLSIAGNVTLSDAKTYIGLTTATIGNTPNVTIGSVTVGNLVSAATIYAVVNTGSASDPHIYIGLVTADIGTIKAWPDPHTYIGLVTITGSLAAASGNVTLDPGSKTGIVGNITLSDSKTYIGLVTATLGNGNPSVQAFGQFFPTLQSIASGGLGPIALDNFGRVQAKLTADPNTFIGLTTAVNGQAWPDPKTFIGLVTVDIGASKAITWAGNVTLSDSTTYIGLTTATLGVSTRFVGLVTVWHGSNVTLNSSSANIGSVSVLGGLIGIAGNVTLSDSKTYLGLTTTTLGVGTTFVGLVTAWTRNAGSAKTLTPFAVTLSTSSVTTIAVPSNANTMYITNIVLNSDATVRLSLKSGVTYMTGNASLGVTLNPGGGFVMTGAPDSPSWIGLPSGALVIEKFDMTGTKANVGGHVVTFTE